MLAYVIRVRIRVRFKTIFRPGCSDYNLATLQSVVLKFKTDTLNVSTIENWKLTYCKVFTLRLSVNYKP